MYVVYRYFVNHTLLPKVAQSDVIHPPYQLHSSSSSVPYYYTCTRRFHVAVLFLTYVV